MVKQNMIIKLKDYQSCKRLEIPIGTKLGEGIYMWLLVGYKIETTKGIFYLRKEDYDQFFDDLWGNKKSNIKNCPELKQYDV